MTSEIDKKSTHVWYVGYGSNLFRERFICYIIGGKFRRGGSYCKGCSDKTLPKDDKPFIIPHSLFFAKNAPKWGNGGVAFVLPHPDKLVRTYTRMWKITDEQFSEIWEQEGKSWYDKKIDLGRDGNGIPIRTITSSSKLEFSRPSDDYLKTIVDGLRETHQLDDKTILKYLIETQGLKNDLGETEITRLFH